MLLNANLLTPQLALQAFIKGKIVPNLKPLILALYCLQLNRLVHRKYNVTLRPMRKILVFRIVFGLVLLCIAFVHFCNYLEYSYAIGSNKPIAYKYISKELNSGRGVSYDMNLAYNNKNYTTSITSKEYDLINKGVYPTLYFSDKSKTIYSKWVIAMNLRISLVMLFVFILVITPWEYIVQHFKKAPKEKH